MNKVVGSLLVLALAVLGTAPLVWGQVTEAQMRALSMPPVKSMRNKALAPGFDFGVSSTGWDDLGTSTTLASTQSLHWKWHEAIHPPGSRER